MSSAGGVKPSETTIALLEDIERRIDPETEEDYKAFAEQFGVQSDWMIYLYQMVVIPNNSANTPFLIPTEDELELEFDVTSSTKTIKFKDQSKKYTIGHSYELLDGTGNRMMSIGWAASPICISAMTCK